MAEAASANSCDSLMFGDGPTDEAPTLMNKLSSLVDSGMYDQIEVLLENGEHDKELRDVTWDLVPLLCTFLTESNQNDKPDTIKSCEVVFDRLCKVSKPKELILVLLDQTNAFVDDVKFKVLLVPIQKSLMSLNVKRSHSLAMALETLYAHVRTLPLPQVESQNLEGRERAMLHMDPAVWRISSVLMAIVDFIRPFVTSATATAENYEEHLKERTDITNMLVKILNHPLVHLDLCHETADNTDSRRTQPMSNGPLKSEPKVKKLNPKSEARVVAEKIAGSFEQLQPDYLKLVDLAEQHNARREAHLKEIKSHVDDEDATELEDPDDYDVEEEIPAGGILCLVYLTLGESLGMSKFPCVYTPQHILEFALPFVSTFLEKPVTFQIEKGLKLMKTWFTSLPDGSLSGDLMSLESLVNSIIYLVKVVVHCPSKETRQSALTIFPLILSKFDDKGRYLYLRYLLNKADHPGLLGYATYMPKDQIDRNLKREGPSPYFMGSDLEKLLNYVFILPEGAASDLLEESDSVLGALNLLRYLILRDNPKENVTGIWDMVGSLDKKYCDPLRTGVNMSRAHYKMEMDKTKKGKYLPKPGDPEMEVSIGNEKMPNLTKDQQMHVLQRALFTFDMIDSVLGRVAELIDQQKKQSAT